MHTTFYLRRLHSLCGLVVLGFFIIEHIATNSVAMAGPAIFNEVMGMVEEIPKPIFYAIEIGVYAIPILFHGLYGIYIALQANNNPRRFGYLRNWNFTLQRWTAWFLVVFLIWHVGYLRISRIRSWRYCTSSECGQRFSISATALRLSA